MYDSPSTVWPVAPLPVVKVKASTSKRLPCPVGPLKTRNNSVVPAGAFARLAETSVKVSQPPVTGTVMVPSRVPVADPVRTSIVPPTPPEATRAVILFVLPTA